MKYWLLYLLIILVFSNCKKITAANSVTGYAAFIAYIDSSGNDLFTDGSNGYIADSVRLYYYQNGVRTMVNNNRPGIIPSQPYGVGTFAHQYDSVNLSGLTIQVDFNIMKDSSTIFIDLKKGVEDTLSCVFINDDRDLYLAWYNGIPKMTAAGKQDPYFIVVK